MTPDELAAYGAELAAETPPLPAHLIEQAARIYVAACSTTRSPLPG